MADYIYLLQTRLTAAQQAALAQIREVARSKNMTVFLAGGAVRDLTSGSPVRDLDVVVQGNATKLKKDLAKGDVKVVGENEAMQALHLSFPGGVRVEVGSTLSVSYPKPGKPSIRPATILEDLRRRDFTANAMAISLNEGSFGLLMDPLNGVADIENREFRLVSNYGFIEDPVRMIRAARLQARLGWQLEERTRQRYETGKSEGYISNMGAGPRAYELEEVFHEEDPLRVIRRLEAEGWMSALSSALSSTKANETELERLRDTVGQLAQMGIHPDPSAAYFPLLTAKLSPKDVTALRAGFARPGFAEQIAALDAEAKAFAAQFTGKGAAAPSDAWKLLLSANPEAILWLAHTSKSSSVQAKFKAFFSEWAQAREKIPYQLMLEMRITPDLPGYADLLETLFFAIMDGKLETPEAARAFLEPYSPPAPPPPVNLRRRPVKRESKAAKVRAKKAPVVTEQVPAAVSASAATASELAPSGKKTAAESVAASAPAKSSSPRNGAKPGAAEAKKPLQLVVAKGPEHASPKGKASGKPTTPAKANGASKTKAANAAAVKTHAAKAKPAAKKASATGHGKTAGKNGKPSKPTATVKGKAAKAVSKAKPAVAKKALSKAVAAKAKLPAKKARAAKKVVGKKPAKPAPKKTAPAKKKTKSKR
jgi:tRNA nucleotidyltransferase (CCA-adding enzyme)